jgi:hypothetical protein
VERLLVEQRRDAEAGLLDEETLDRVAEVGRLASVEVSRAGDPADLAETVREARPDPLRIQLGLAPEQLERPGAQPSCASFSSSVIRASRSATRASIGRVGSW